MRRGVAILFGVLLLAAPVQAQLTIHDHPQKAVYASPDEWVGGALSGVPPDSGQVHWLRRDGVLAHTHVDCIFPRYAELSAPIPVTCTILLFHTPGRVIRFVAGIYKHATQRDVIWADTGTSVMPAIIGDPNGIVTASVSFTFDPAAEVDNPHGWASFGADADTLFDDGAITNAIMASPFWSFVDPTAPVQGGDFPFIFAEAHSSSTQFPLRFYGAATSEIANRLPLAAISQAWPLPDMATYDYGGRDGGVETTEFVLDPDYHHANNGTTLFSAVTPADFVHQFVSLDPGQTGPGVHKFVVRRCETNAPEMLCALLVTFAAIDPNAPPVVLPPPVVTPPPPPPPVGEQFSTVCMVTTQVQVGNQGTTKTLLASTCPTN